MDMHKLAVEILKADETIREALYCAVVDHYRLTRVQQRDLMIYCAEMGWER